MNHRSDHAAHGFFFSAQTAAPRWQLLYAITNDEGIVKVTGEVGSGKTMLCRVLIESPPKNVETIYLANPSLGRDEFCMPRRRTGIDYCMIVPAG